MCVQPKGIIALQDCNPIYSWPACRWLLPGSIATARFLSDAERQALQEEMAKHQPQLQANDEPKPAAASCKNRGTAAECVEQQQQPGGCWGGCRAPQRPHRRTLAEDWAALKVALRCPIVYCSGAWRCLYAMAVYGLQVGARRETGAVYLDVNEAG